MHRLPPALAASVTPRILELLGNGPGRVLEFSFAGMTRIRFDGCDLSLSCEAPR